MYEIVSKDLGISTERDFELMQLTFDLFQKTKSVAAFILEIEKKKDLNLIEKLYITAQMGRFRGVAEGEKMVENKIKKNHETHETPDTPDKTPETPYIA